MTNRIPNTKCVYCSRPLYRRPCNLRKFKKVYCIKCRSIAASENAKKQKVIERERKLEKVKLFRNWKNGWEHPYNIRREIIADRGHQCQICETTLWNDRPIPLILDHIDGNANNWDDSNLRLICPNCDAQTDTYKNKNRGNGRAYRRKRYKEGKSY